MEWLPTHHLYGVVFQVKHSAQKNTDEKKPIKHGLFEYKHVPEGTDYLLNMVPGAGVEL